MCQELDTHAADAAGRLGDGLCHHCDAEHSAFRVDELHDVETVHFFSLFFLVFPHFLTCRIDRHPPSRCVVISDYVSLNLSYTDFDVKTNNWKLGMHYEYIDSIGIAVDKNGVWDVEVLFVVCLVFCLVYNCLHFYFSTMSEF
jgi:hypothetical protein